MSSNLLTTDLLREFLTSYYKTVVYNLQNNIPKIILAHKMYGFPFLDTDGKYGISNRDNYVICHKTVADLEQIAAFLRTKTALYIFEATRYRMKYLEKYAFEFIPDITKLDDFPKEPTDETIADYFDFDNTDRENIAKLHKKEYDFLFINGL